MSISCFNALAETPPVISQEGPENGEKIFITHADECLAIIEAAAIEISIEGVSMIAYIPGDVTESWVSKMNVVGKLSNEEYNLCAIAYCKASEMAVTLKNSGNKERGSITGEFGWPGGVIIELDSGYLLAAFSGGSSQQDVDVSQKGLDWLVKKWADPASK